MVFNRIRLQHSLGQQFAIIKKRPGQISHFNCLDRLLVFIQYTACLRNCREFEVIVIGSSQSQMLKYELLLILNAVLIIEFSCFIFNEMI